VRLVHAHLPGRGGGIEAARLGGRLQLPELPARGLQDGADRERAPGELRRALPRAAGRGVSPPGDRRRPVGRTRAPPGGRRHRTGRQGRHPGRPPDCLHPSAPRARHADPVLGGARVRRPAAALMRLEAVTLDAVGTLIAVAEPIGRTYARFATRHGIALAPDEAERGFGEALADAPPLAFPGVDAARLAERERAWWSAVVRRAVGPAAERPSFDRCFAELFAHYGRPEAWRVFPEVPEALRLLRAHGRAPVAFAGAPTGRVPRPDFGSGLGTPRHIGSRCGGMEESGDVLRVMHLLSKFTDMALDGLTWTAARSAVDAVRFQPAHTKLLMACGASQADAPQRWVGGVAAL